MSSRRPSAADHQWPSALASAQGGDDLRADTVRIAGGPAAEFVRARIMRGLRILARQSRHDDRKKETIRARGLFTFDTDRSSYRLFGFDDHGFTHAGPVRGACVNDTLTVPRRSPRSHAV